MELFDDYEIISVEPDIRKLDYYKYTLDSYKKNGIKKCFKYGDKILYPGIEHSAVWNLCGGMPIEEYNRRKEINKAAEIQQAHRRDFIPKDDLRRIEEAKAVRNEMKDGKKIIEENIISGLKFMAENTDLSQDDFVKGLIARGCVFTINDIHDEYVEPYTMDKFRDGHIEAAAYVLANARDSESARKRLEGIHFNVDDDYSAYHFIRVSTGDLNYTKEYVKSLKNKKSY